VAVFGVSGKLRRFFKKIKAYKLPKVVIMVKKWENVRFGKVMCFDREENNF
jgi:hypothetical protein